MPRILDHPLRLHRLTAGIGQQELADAIGAHRSTLAAIEEARTASPTAETVAALERQLKLAPGQLATELERWRARRAAAPPMLTPTARATLELQPAAIAMLPSFVAWRLRIAPTTAAFATMLSINRTVLANYERGIRERGMPETLAHAILSVLGVSTDYLLALERLPPTED